MVQDERSINISDFGLARIIDRTEEDEKRSYELNLTKFPCWWYAPESLGIGLDGSRNNTRIFNHKSDVWSYGITSWEILTLCKYDVPYRNETQADLWKPYEERHGERFLTEALKDFLADGNIVDQPKYRDMHTCSNIFWDNHMKSEFERNSNISPFF